jgi:hypothetical protein
MCVLPVWNFAKEATQMKLLSKAVNHFYDAKDRIMQFINPDPDFMRVHCNLTVDKHTRNFHGSLPEHFVTNDKFYPGLKKVLAIAEIKPGWKKGAPVIQGDVPLLEFVFARIANAKGKASSATQKRRAKV